MATVLITGGTGLIGKALTTALLAKGHDVIILSRKLPNNNNYAASESKVTYAEWNVQKQHVDPAAIRNADYIVHLAGANVAEGRWTTKRKTEILSSRTESGKLIVNALKEVPNKVKAIISASAIGYYGPDPHIPNPHPFSESDDGANDFLGATCKEWESSIQPVINLGKRLVILRTGIVLSKQGGAFTEFLKPLQYKLAAILGNGKQVISWIHIDDLVLLYITALEREEWNGIYNAVAPHPVNNEDLVKAIAHHKSKIFLPISVPAFTLKLLLGEMSIEVLKSTTVSSSKVQSQHYKFLFTDIKSAVENLLA